MPVPARSPCAALIETFREAFCREYSCSFADFERRALLAALYSHAQVVTLFVGYRTDRFTLDRAIINYCGTLRARTDMALMAFLTFLTLKVLPRHSSCRFARTAVSIAAASLSYLFSFS